MLKRLTLATAALALAVTPALAGGSGQHSARASDHGAAGPAVFFCALPRGATVAVALPVLAAGSAIAVTGAAIESVGDEVLEAGSNIAASGSEVYIIEPQVRPNSAPALD